MFDSAQEEARRTFTEIETSFSPGTKDLSSPIVINLYHKALKVYQDSNGCFDITVAPLLHLWGFLDKSHSIPTFEETKNYLKYIGMDKIKEEKGNLVLPLKMKLDWGGIAKGLGVDLASQALKELGINRGFVNAGGDLFCWGKNPDNQAWKIAIKHPRKSGFLGVLIISNLAAATTGDYQRYFEREGVRYHHVFDPSTGYPSEGKQSMTVVGPESALCDALSTALFVSPHPEKILKKYPDYGAICVDSEGTVTLLGKTFLLRLLEQ